VEDGRRCIYLGSVFCRFAAVFLAPSFDAFPLSPLGGCRLGLLLPSVVPAPRTPDRINGVYVVASKGAVVGLGVYEAANGGSGVVSSW
jgi:hypothetical protein